MHKAVERLVAEKGFGQGVIITSLQRRPSSPVVTSNHDPGRPGTTPARIFTMVEDIGATCAPWRLWAFRLSPPSTARRSAAASRSPACLHPSDRRRRQAAQLGLPRSPCGLLPGGGGVARTVRMMGIQNAFVNVLSQGTRFKPAKGQDVGLVDEVVGSDRTHPAAKAWIKANPKPTPSRGMSGLYKMLAAPPARGFGRRILPSFPAAAEEVAKNAADAGPRAILAAAVERAGRLRHRIAASKAAPLPLSPARFRRT